MEPLGQANERAGSTRIVMSRLARLRANDCNNGEKLRRRRAKKTKGELAQFPVALSSNWLTWSRPQESASLLFGSRQFIWHRARLDTRGKRREEGLCLFRWQRGSIYYFAQRGYMVISIESG